MGNLPITLFDIAVVAIVLISALLALSRGLIREVLALATWIGAALIAWYGFASVRPLVREAVGGDLLADMITGAGLFIAALIVLKILGGIAASGVSASGLGLIDRAAGLAFGLARGVAIVCAAWLIFGSIAGPDRPPAWAAGSLLLPQVERGASWLQSWLPSGVAEQGRAAASRAGEQAKSLDGVRDVLRTPRPPAGDEPGYTDEQRRQMDQMFKPDG